MEFMEYLRRAFPAPSCPHADLARDIYSEETSPTDAAALRALVTWPDDPEALKLFDEIRERYLREQQA
ncbi:MAG: hypothetical protein ITG02_10805 [Patulibacter sp.]|nr:hypothetical protein [Patulibacter sp.]